VPGFDQQPGKLQFAAESPDDVLVVQAELDAGRDDVVECNDLTRVGSRVAV
jgi:hypothetical protein